MSAPSSELLYWFLDIQTTGTSPDQDAITEVAWSGPLSRQEVERLGDSSVALPPIASCSVALPCEFTWKRGALRRWLQFSGMSEENLRDAREPSLVWGLITAALRQNVPGNSRQRKCASVAASCAPDGVHCVVHFAAFERRFLPQLAAEGATAFDIICTYQLARQLLPELPSKSLRAVAGYFGHFVGPLKRAEAHVAATMRAAGGLFLLWNSAQSANHDPGCALPLEVPAVRLHGINREERLRLPECPGVYRFVGPGGVTLYIGKANSLRTRVNSYFRGRRSRGSRLHEMLAIVQKVTYATLATGLHAVALESVLIKALDPPYNRAQKHRQRQFVPGFLSSGPLLGRPLLGSLIRIVTEIMCKPESASASSREGWLKVREDAFRLAGRALFEPGTPHEVLLREAMLYARLMIADRRMDEPELEEEGDTDTDDEGASDHKVSNEGDGQDRSATRAAAVRYDWMEEGDALLLSAQEWTDLIQFSFRQLLRLSLRARRVHRIAHADIRITANDSRHGTLAPTALKVRGGLPVIGRDEGFTDDPLLAAHLVARQDHTQSDHDTASVGFDWDLEKWDCCSAVLGEVARMRTAGFEVRVDWLGIQSDRGPGRKKRRNPSLLKGHGT